MLLLQSLYDIISVSILGYFFVTFSDEVAENWSPGVCKWARVRLPNGQVARSSWKEKLKPLTKVRMARNIKV